MAQIPALLAFGKGTRPGVSCLGLAILGILAPFGAPLSSWSLLCELFRLPVLAAFLRDAEIGFDEINLSPVQ